MVRWVTRLAAVVPNESLNLHAGHPSEHHLAGRTEMDQPLVSDYLPAPVRAAAAVMRPLPLGVQWKPR